jgi:hypothetical protein
VQLGIFLERDEAMPLFPQSAVYINVSLSVPGRYEVGDTEAGRTVSRLPSKLHKLLLYVETDEDVIT